jgi:hypothetical protein
VDVFFELVKLTLYMLVSALLIAMTARAILSWFPLGENKITGFFLFLWPLTWTFTEAYYGAVAVCSIATFAAVQEGFYLTANRNSK